MAAKGLSQRDMAVILECSLERVKAITSGRVAKFKPEEMRRLVQTLNLSAHWLATGEGPMFDEADGEVLGERVSSLKLISARIAALDLSEHEARIARDVAYGVAIGDAAVIRASLFDTALTPDERTLISGFRAASAEGRAAMLLATAGIAAQAPKVAQNFHAPVRQVAAGDIVNQVRSRREKK